MNTHVVLRKLPGLNAEPGTQVDASEYRNLALLVKQRYLKPLDAAAAADGEVSPAVFEQRVVAAIKKNLAENGELAQLLHVSAKRKV